MLVASLIGPHRPIMVAEIGRKNVSAIVFGYEIEGVGGLRTQNCLQGGLAWIANGARRQAGNDVGVEGGRAVEVGLGDGAVKSFNAVTNRWIGLQTHAQGQTVEKDPGD